MDERDRLLAEIEREFSAHVVHQVKTPLALMHGYAETLLERDLPEEQRRWFLEVIAKQSRELSQALDRLDELRRLHEAEEGGRTDIGEALQMAASRLANERPGVTMSMAAGAGTGTEVVGPLRWVTRAIVEAIAAAIDEDGEVAVRVRRVSSVTITIDASGTIRQHALGLYLARRVAERFGGGLTVQGSRVTLRFEPA